MKPCQRMSEPLQKDHDSSTTRTSQFCHTPGRRPSQSSFTATAGRSSTASKDTGEGDGTRNWQRSSAVIAAINNENEKDVKTDVFVSAHDVETASTSNTSSLQSESSLVAWEAGDDPANPKNFHNLVKLFIGIIIGLMNFIVSFAISAFSGVLDQVEEDVGYGRSVVELGVSLFILGLALGPAFWGPASEFYGRKRPLVSGMIGFVAFTSAVATTKELAPLLVYRFLSGFCGSAAYVIPPGVFVDLYGPVGRSIGYSIFASGAFIGGSLGPVMGSLLVLKYELDWRWSMWVNAIFALPLILAMIVLPESLEAVILQRKAQRLRQQTGDWALHCRRDELPVKLHKYLVKPWQMLIYEPVLVIVVLAFTLDYGLQTLTYSAMPVAFQRSRGWNVTESASALIITIPGFMLGCIVIVLDTKLRFQKRLAEGGVIEPEKRLPPMIAGMTLLSSGLLCFAWTTSSSVALWEQIMAEVVVGIGMYMVWVTATVYVQDLYTEHANSALAACAFVRYATGAGFPVLTTPLYDRFGIQWSIASLGILAGVLVPFHILFYFFGKKVRGWSKFALHSRVHLESEEARIDR